LLDINVTKSVHSTPQQIDPALNLKKLKNRFTLRKDERKLQYGRSNISGFINTRYFTSGKVPHGIKNATHNTLSNFRKKLAAEIKISSFFRKWLNTNKRFI
jgi:hypothetical protein